MRRRLRQHETRATLHRDSTMPAAPIETSTVIVVATRPESFEQLRGALATAWPARVVEVRSVDDSCALAAREPPQALLLVHDGPGRVEDGDSLARLASAARGTPAPCALVVLADPVPDRALEAGADEVLPLLDLTPPVLGRALDRAVLRARFARARHADEAALREREAVLRSTFENAAVGIAHVGLDGRWLGVNEQVYAITGYTREELLSSSFQAITHPDDVDMDVALAARVARGELGSYSIEKRYVRPNGDVVWVQLTVSGHRGPSGRVEHFISVVQDITRRRLAEQRLQAALEASRTGTFRWNIRTDELDWDESLDRLFGLVPGQAVHSLEQFITHVHPDERQGVIERCLRCKRDGADFEMEFRVVHPDGTVRWLYDRGRTIRDPDGVPAYMTGACVDITERKIAERALRDQDRRKDEFLAVLAHELRNPLAPLRTGLEILRRSSDLASVARVREVMERQLAHLVRLVDDLLDLSRIGQGKIVLRRERKDLRTLIDSALESCRPAIEIKSHALSLSLPTDSLPVDADPTRVEQVLGNLLTNAAKYTEPGGRIRIEAKRAGGAAVVRVTDSGIGIEADQLPRVWDLFAQVQGSADMAQGGLGIGLALVKRLVEMHGGSVAAESAGRGRGSTFEVRLPLASGAADAASAATPEAGASTQGMRMLVVDDNVDGADMFAALLEMSGHQVRVAHSGADALETAVQSAPNMIFLDIGLPDISGYEVARRLRQRPEFARTRLVAVTGWGTAADKRRAAEAGFDDHLTKPIDLNALELVLARFASP